MKSTTIIKTEADRQSLIERILKAPLDKPWRVTVEYYKKKRSLDQNDLFHVLMREVSQKYAEHYGEFVSPIVWKEYFKQQHLGQETTIIKGKAVATTRHTGDLNVQEMTDLIEFVYMYCSSELGIYLGTPGERIMG